MVFTASHYRPGFGRVLTVIVCTLAAASLIGVFLAGDVEAAVRIAPIPALIAALSWALFWRPVLSITEGAVVVVNVFRTNVVPWAAIQRIETKFALTLHTADGAIEVWAAPAPSRFAVMGMTREDTRFVSESAKVGGDFIRPGDALSTASGAAAHGIRVHWEQLRDDGELDRPGSDRAVVRTLHRTTIIVLAALVIAAALGALL